MNTKLRKIRMLAAWLLVAATIGQAGAAGPQQRGVEPTSTPMVIAAPLLRSYELSAARDVLPEPGNWAIFLVGLLGVGAIARRRMSV